MPILSYPFHWILLGGFICLAQPLTSLETHVMLLAPGVGDACWIYGCMTAFFFLFQLPGWHGLDWAELILSRAA
jgi:hypothetical protein